MHAVHLEDVVRGRQHHPVVLRQNHGLEDINYLGDVGHLQAVGIFMKNVERKGSHEGIAQGVLLIEVAGNGTRLLVPPCAPFVQNQRNLLLGVVTVHDGTMLLDDIFHLATLAQRPVIVLVGKLRGRALAAAPACHRVVMQRKSLHASAHAVHEDVGPVVVVVAGTAGYLEQAVAVVVAAVGGITAVQVGVIFGTHAAAASPALVAHAEVFHLPGLVASVLATQAGHG